MKKFATFIGAFMMFFAPTLVSAASAESSTFNRAWRGYGNSFIFVEQGIEFAVFPDGQFDFNLDRYATNFGVNANLGNANISFNTGFGYDAYIQYDDFGAVIQIENVPIFYDHFGRIVQAGNVFINYNNRGFVNRVGGMNIFYNRFNVFTHHTGFINRWNRAYVFRPWHQFYVIPRAQFCVLWNRPYRQFYNPIRHNWYRPYRNNARPVVSFNAGRRGTRVATNNTVRRSDRYVQSRSGRRDNVAREARRTSSRNAVARESRRGNTANTVARTDRSSRVERNEGAQRGRPVTTTSRGDRVKRDKGTVNRGRPVVNTSRNDNRKRVTTSSRKSQNRSSRVSTNTQKRKIGRAHV